MQWMVGIGSVSLALHALGGSYLSPAQVVATSDGRCLYVTDATARSLSTVELPGRTVGDRIRLKAEPTGIAISTNDALLAVTEGIAQGTLQLVSTAQGKVTATFAVGHSPCAPVLSPDGHWAYICNRYLNRVSVVDLTCGKVVDSIPVVREPVAAVGTSDGTLLLVANALPLASATSNHVAAVISLIDTAQRKAVAAIALPNGSSSVRGIALSPDGRYAYVTHIVSHFQLPTTQLERGWMNTAALSIIEVSSKSLFATVLLDDVDRGAADPSGVACTGEGRMLVVTHAGTHELSVIDRATMHAKMDRLGKGEKVSLVSRKLDDVAVDLSFLVDCRWRITLPGKGPRGVVVVGRTAYVAEYFSDALAAVDLMEHGGVVAGSVPLGPVPKPDRVRRGEMLFSDATLCFQQWQSCMSCHPEVRVDGLNWDLLNDGIGNPKQTKSLLLSHRTPPAMMTGIRESAEVAVRSGLKFIEMAVRPEEEARAIDAFLRSLEPVSSPYLEGGSLSEAAKRGKKVFRSTGCAQCHPSSLFTDKRQHDVGTGSGSEAGRLFDTPTLVEIWRTAPYLYDGRALDLKEVLTGCNPEDRHGRTSTLTAAEQDDLVQYLLSL